MPKRRSKRRSKNMMLKCGCGSCEREVLWEAYHDAAIEIFEYEWNRDTEEPDDWERAVLDQADRFDRAVEARRKFKVVK
jgi:hypothetical protein